MVNEGFMFLKARRTLAKSWLKVCEQDKEGTQKGLVLHSKVAMKGLGGGKKHLQQNIVDHSKLAQLAQLAFQLIQTDETFTVNGRKYTHTYTHERVLPSTTENVASAVLAFAENEI